MTNELKTIFEQIDKNIFSEDMLEKISNLVEAAVQQKTEARVQLAVEAACSELDEQMTVKMEHLVKTLKENIDKDHLAKIQYVVESINNDHLGKVLQLKENYERVLKETAKNDKMQLVEAVDTFIEQYIDKNLPKEIIEEAAKNTHVANVLAEARKVLAVDDSFIKKEYKEAFLDGKQQVDRLLRENAELKKAKALGATEKFIDEKCANLPANTAKFVKARLSNKPLNVVKENFDYVVEMYELNEKKRKNSLLKENTTQIPNVDRSKISGDALIKESNEHKTPVQPIDPTMSMYMEFLNSRNL